MRALPVDRVPYLRARAIARVATVVTLVLAGYAAFRMVVLAASGNPFAMVWFLMLVAVTWVGGVGLFRAWRRSRSLRPVVLSVDPTPGEVYGISELDQPPQPHRSLSGEVEPPRRW